MVYYFCMSTFKRNDVIVIISALVVGLLSGSYLYMTAFAPTYQDALNPDTYTRPGAYTIIGETYGGMRFGVPPTFRLEANGSFTYIPFAEDPNIPPAIVSGEIPSWLQEELAMALNPDSLESASQPITPEMCAQMVDGLEYRYQIMLDEMEYTLDTCGTNFTSDSALGQALLTIWEVAEGAIPAP